MTYSAPIRTAYYDLAVPSGMGDVGMGDVLSDATFGYEDMWTQPGANPASGYGAAGAFGVQAGGQLIAGGFTTENIVLSAPSIAGGVLSALVGAGSLWSAAAIPIIGVAVVGVTLGLQLLFGRKGPKQKVATTEIVNQVEPLLEENVQGYLAGPRTLQSQQQAIENFKAGWQFVLENCGAEVMGEPGRRCILERQEGARPSWGPNWFELYLDPIRNDPNVKHDTTSVVNSTLNNAGLPDIFTPAPEGGSVLQSKLLGLPVALIAAGLVLVLATNAGSK